jgi:hypothetical protein
LPSIDPVGVIIGASGSVVVRDSHVPDREGQYYRSGTTIARRVGLATANNLRGCRELSVIAAVLLGPMLRHVKAYKAKK